MLGRDVNRIDGRARPQSQAMMAGCVLAAVIVAGYAVLALLRPQPVSDNAPIVIDQQSGALFVRVGETLHPVPNLASARLIAATDADPRPVRASVLAGTGRGPLMGIAGAPQFVGRPLPGADAAWAICDGAPGASRTTTVIVGAADGPRGGPHPHRLTPGQAVLVTADDGATTYLLYRGRRALVNLTDPAVSRALRLENAVPRPVSAALLNATVEAPPLAPPRIPGAGRPGPAGLSAFPIGTVLRLARADGDEYYVVLAAGLQRVGRVAADLLRLTDSRGTRRIISVAPDVVRSSRVVNTLPVTAFPDRPPAPADGATLCMQWVPAGQGVHVSLLTGDELPVPAGGAPVSLSQADGGGPAVDAVYVPPGRSVYVRSTGLSGGGSGARYLVVDTGVRFAVHDDDAARDLGLPVTAVPAPWPVLSALPSGPELSRRNALTARDTVPEVPGSR